MPGKLLTEVLRHVGQTFDFRVNTQQKLKQSVKRSRHTKKNQINNKKQICHQKTLTGKMTATPIKIVCNPGEMPDSNMCLWWLMRNNNSLHVITAPSTKCLVMLTTLVAVKNILLSGHLYWLSSEAL